MAGTREIFRNVKILELGAGAAGPVSTRYFGEQGARVIRIESAARPDFLRLLHLTAENRNDPDILDKAPMFVLLNPNKESLTLNMKSPEAVAIVKQLADWADVVSENFAPGVMERWGLGAEVLREQKPELIVVSGCLFGQTGPQRSYPGFGGQGSAISGFNHLTGHPDHEAHGPYGTITDSLTPRYVAVAVAAALIERRRSGRGQTIDVSQIECGVYSLSATIARFSANGEIDCRRENHAEFAAPHSVYPCEGEDRWIAIAVHGDDEWRRLTAAMGHPAWAEEKKFETVVGRLEHQDELDAKLAGWTSGFDRYALMELLQAAEVEAGVVQTMADIQHDPQLAHRGHFETLHHDCLGDLRYERSGIRISGSEAGYHAPAPKLGEHNHEILAGELGLSEARIQELIETGVVA